MTERDNGQDVGLEGLFAAARAEPPVPDAEFMSRLTDGALAEMPPAPGLWRQLRAALGGWPGVAGLVTACAAGLWIGLSPPVALDALWGDSAGLGAVGLDPLSGFELTMMEG